MLKHHVVKPNIAIAKIIAKDYFDGIMSPQQVKSKIAALLKQDKGRKASTTITTPSSSTGTPPSYKNPLDLRTFCQLSFPACSDTF